MGFRLRPFSCAAAGLADNLAVREQTPFDMPLAWFGICREPVAGPVVTAGRDPAAPPEVQTSWAPAWTRDDRARRVAAVRERIARGDTYQCNLTERMQAHLSGEPYALYRDLAVGQRAAYSAYLDLGRWVVASASPELFFERRGDHILLRPMKGTGRRGRFPEEDRRPAGQLRSSEKERAENLRTGRTAQCRVGAGPSHLRSAAAPSRTVRR